jgi:hypothetical protein
MSDFWKSWLNIWAWGVIVFGAILAIFAFPATEEPTRFLFELFGATLPEVADYHHRFAIGLMGCVTVGWGLTLLPAFKSAHLLDRGAAAPIWRSMTFAVLFWYLIDSSISLYTGIAMNAVSNTLVIALYLLPVIKSQVLKG